MIPVAGIFKLFVRSDWNFKGVRIVVVVGSLVVMGVGFLLVLLGVVPGKTGSECMDENENAHMNICIIGGSLQILVSYGLEQLCCGLGLDGEEEGHVAWWNMDPREQQS